MTSNTLLLCILVAIFTTLIAVPCSIFVTMFDFYGRKFFSWALCLSLAFPIYVYAFIFVGAAEEVSFISGSIRENIVLSGLVMSLGLYPYTFLLCKAQLRKILFQEFGAFLGNKGADRNIEEVFRISVDVMEFISEAASFKMRRLSPRLEPRLSVAFS